MVSPMLLRVVDFETSGEKPNVSVVEVGWCDVRIGDGLTLISDPKSMLVNPGPGFEMAHGARGVHHIDPAYLEGAAPFSEANRRLTEELPVAYVAHHADFEHDLFQVYVGGAEIPWICTRKVALRLPYIVDDYKNQTLRYFHGHDRRDPRFTALAMPPHRAGPDAWVTAHNLVEDLKVVDVETMITWSREPALLPRIMFGTKHRGQPWSEAEADYLTWIVTKSELDADTKWNAQHELDRRVGVARADYVRACPAALAKIGTAGGLNEWFVEETLQRVDLGIVKGTPEYDQIAAIGAARKAELASQARAAGTA